MERTGQTTLLVDGSGQLNVWTQGSLRSEPDQISMIKRHLWFSVTEAEFCKRNLRVIVYWYRSLPASLPACAGGGFGGPGGDDLTVDGAQQQHEPDGPEHLGGRYPMRLRDGHVEYGRHHCRSRPPCLVQQSQLRLMITDLLPHLAADKEPAVRGKWLWK